MVKEPKMSLLFSKCLNSDQGDDYDMFLTAEKNQSYIIFLLD
jgi:hypothetical protein